MAVSDNHMIYAAEIAGGGIRDRCFAPLAIEEPPADELFWLSLHGIYRPAHERGAAMQLPGEPDQPAATDTLTATDENLLHPKYGLPATCFAYVGDASDPKTWHLPYLLADGAVDLRRLPKAVQAILTNYRGAKVSSVPEADIPDVLVRLACAAMTAGKMPDQLADPAAAYRDLAAVLEQFGRSDDVKPLGAPLEL